MLSFVVFSAEEFSHPFSVNIFLSLMGHCGILISFRRGTAWYNGERKCISAFTHRLS